MASGSDGKGRHGRPGGRPPGGGRRAELEAELDRLQEEIDELWDEIKDLEDGVTDVTRIDVDLDTFIERKRVEIDELEAKRAALQE